MLERVVSRSGFPHVKQSFVQGHLSFSASFVMRYNSTEEHWSEQHAIYRASVRTESMGARLDVRSDLARACASMTCVVSVSLEFSA